MKISLIITNDAKQVMMTPETDQEREALKWISPNDTLEVVAKMGTLFDNETGHANYQICENQAGYYRIFETAESLMFVIRKKENKK